MITLLEIIMKGMITNYFGRTGINIGLTNIRRYKRQTVHKSDRTNVKLVQMSDWYKHWTRTNIGLVQM